MADLVLTESLDSGVSVLRLNNPPMNALSRAMLGEIRDAARALAADANVKAVVVVGGEKAFAAGADITEFGDQAAAREIEQSFRDAFDAIASIPRPVIAAVRGFALGGGLELAMACDLRFAGEAARMGQPEIMLGINPGAGGTQRLTRLVGPARAKDLIWSGKHVRADQALANVLVDRVVTPGEDEHAAVRWAVELGAGAVVAMGLAKDALDRGLDGSLAAGLDRERDKFIEVFATDDAQTGVKSFLENGPGKAKFSGR
jgi:enoyl-CoA hydratase